MPPSSRRTAATRPAPRRSPPSEGLEANAADPHGELLDDGAAPAATGRSSRRMTATSAKVPVTRGSRPLTAAEQEQKKANFRWGMKVAVLLVVLIAAGAAAFWFFGKEDPKQRVATAALADGRANLDAVEQALKNRQPDRARAAVSAGKKAIEIPALGNAVTPDPKDPNLAGVPYGAQRGRTRAEVQRLQRADRQARARHQGRGQQAARHRGLRQAARVLGRGPRQVHQAGERLPRQPGRARGRPAPRLRRGLPRPDHRRADPGREDRRREGAPQGRRDQGPGGEGPRRGRGAGQERALQGGARQARRVRQEVREGRFLQHPHLHHRLRHAVLEPGQGARREPDGGLQRARHRAARRRRRARRRAQAPGRGHRALRRRDHRERGQGSPGQAPGEVAAPRGMRARPPRSGPVFPTPR